MTTAERAAASNPGICPECGRIQYLYDHCIDTEQQRARLYLACPLCATERSESIVEVALVSQGMENVVIPYAQALVQLSAAKKKVAEQVTLVGDAPTPQALANALRIYHLLRQAVTEAWQEIPESQRQVLQPPEHYG
jgi:hypothetical protein